ncbi:centriolar and ciliogenesis-associated protein hyls-1 [Battus philenor]|uniref:centriolar and ciliogenesis-associated protein hyls-1 n=1 Tax=Battus philenor TaxID=42288 RepID=UPI0035CFE3C8
MDYEDYYEITSQVDAREILRYLNNLGIHNISGEVLKYFITDLKKLIKYDLQQRIENVNTKNSFALGPERLHSASTFSSRSRSRSAITDTCCSKQSGKRSIKLDIRNIQSAPDIAHSKQFLQSKRSCSCTRNENKLVAANKEPRKITPTLTNNLIKIPKQPIKKKCDPVSLYHYYTSLWAKFKPNVPGENNWSELRWSIRQKMAGNSSQALLSNKINDKHVAQIKK